MKFIIAIDLLSQLLDADLPKVVRETGSSLHHPDLYKGPLLNPNTQKRLRHSRTKGYLFEIPCSEKDMLRYHQEFQACELQCYLAFEDFVAVVNAKEQGYVLLADKGRLQRYATSLGVEVMSLKELKDRCEQRHRQDRRRKERLRAYHSRPGNMNKEEEPLQQFIDDDTSF